MADKRNNQLPDMEQRRIIDSELDRSMLVEAAAGTGKTTKMIDRMVALLRDGGCDVGKMAAITFTRKAAAQLRSRFRTRLEIEARESSGTPGRRLGGAAENVGKCYIGTIHSFCARLLRERPVEAGVPLEFEPVEADEDERIRLEAWDSYCTGLYAADDGGLPGRMADLGMDIGDLRECFVRFADYPDVESWPQTPSGPLPDSADVRSGLYRYLEHIRAEVTPLIEDAGNDKLLQLYERLPFFLHHTDWSDAASVERLLLKFDKENDPVTVQKQWPGAGREEKKAFIASELERLHNIRDKTARPWLGKLYEHRYALAMEAFRGARARYDRLRAERKVLNFQDLLIRCAALLREGGANIRSYFARRFTHLLVDEFQDTDPVQAEVMLLLTADDPTEKEWRRCRPRPGSLFIVGDPKQSIYRFRRADLVTYNEVKKIISAGGGAVPELSSNFRSVPPVLKWVNESFEGRFPPDANDYSPPYVRLSAGLGDGPGDPGEPCVQVLKVPKALRKREEVQRYEAVRIAGYINRALECGMKIKRSGQRGPGGPVRPRDFMIITWGKANLGLYAQQLDACGIPNIVTGGTVLNEVAQVRRLYTYMAALVHPHDPVALVAALRSELFGVSDPELYEFKKRGGRFDWRNSVPDNPGDAANSDIGGIFEHFHQSRELVDTLPAMTAIERIACSLGLPAMAGASAGGNVQAGSFGKAIELLRSARADQWSISRTVEYLGELARSEEPHDGTPARSFPEGPVRIMNLHKVKGLQAPIVFLAGPYGFAGYPPDFHIDRRRRGGARGYLKLSKSEGFARRTLALPPDWKKWEEEEEKFASAERKRLLYVAATRAENRLIITRREKGGRSNNPWAFFEATTAGCPVVDTQGNPPTARLPSKAETPGEEEESMIDTGAELERIRKSKKLIQRAGYARQRAKPEMQPPGGTLPGRHYGMEWGSLLHTLLETSMKAPAADLVSVARSATCELDMPGEFVEKAVDVVKSLAGDPENIFARARRGERFLTEVPFTYRQCEENGRPLLISGVVDLAFQEEDGWVVVDYKTDAGAVEEAGRAALTEKYAAQVENYVRAWRECTGETVKEAGIYYTEGGEYVRCFCRQA